MFTRQDVKQDRYDRKYRHIDLHWHVCGDAGNPVRFQFDPRLGCGAVFRHNSNDIKENKHRCVRCGQLLPMFRVLPSDVRKHIQYLRRITIPRESVHA